MASQSRRNFIKTSVAIGAGLTGINSRPSKAAPRNILDEDRMGVLVDTTVCIGCRKCEWACKEAHNMETPSLETYEDRTVYEKMRRPDDKALTIINEYPAVDHDSFPIDVKIQCMHCDKPACVSACIVGAMTKEKNGAVIWDGGKCIGCRYCMVACPFQIPAFEYHKAIQPEIRKCDFCFERTKVGKLPACVEICPMEALTYGKRKDLVNIAHQKIKLYPEKYIDHVYGEYEVGGTSWIYLANKDFAELQFPKLNTNTAPGVSEAIQHGIFAYFVPPIALYALLGGVMWLNKNKKKNEKEEEI